jgi:hypothetical protein
MSTDKQIKKTATVPLYRKVLWDSVRKASTAKESLATFVTFIIKTNARKGNMDRILG